MSGRNLILHVLCCTLLTLATASAQLVRVSFEGHSYAFVNQRMTWHVAKAYAERMGGYLACIGSAEENEFIANLVGSTCSWIGFTDEEEEGNWVWINGEPVIFVNWGVSQPNDNLGLEEYGCINWEYSVGGTEFGAWNDYLEYPVDVDGSDGVPGLVIEWDSIEPQVGFIVGWGDSTDTKLDVPEFDDIIRVDAGWQHSLAIRSDGSLLGWGLNNAGQSDIPANEGQFIDVSCGNFWGMALDQNGSILAWGDNWQGKATVPSPNSGFVAISAGANHGLGLKGDGTIVTWGDNGYGQRNVPSPNSDFVAIAAGWDQSVALKSDGTVVMWGYNYGGCYNLPVPNGDFNSVYAGANHHAGIRTDGTALGWACNESGQSNFEVIPDGYKALAPGYTATLAVTNSGLLLGVGSNEYGLLSFPDSIVNGTVSHVSCTAAHVLAIVSSTASMSGNFTFEHFNHSGSLPEGWTSDSQARSTPWAPVLESGEDWSVETTHEAFDLVSEEWLKSPTYDLTWYQDIQLGFTHEYEHSNSSAAVRYSTNGGLSWNTWETFSETTSGQYMADISSWADGEQFVKFAFRFIADAPSGPSSWRIDDFYLDGIPTAPVASDPVPSQPPAIWTSLTGTIGCSWTQPVGIKGDSLQVRIDANGDGDYLDGGSEEWTALPALPDSGSITCMTEATWLVGGGPLHFEFRAKSVGGDWGYSGTANQVGMADDWFVLINADTDPPVFSDLVPTNQPYPDWVGSYTQNAGATIEDLDSGVDASSLQWRIDWDHSGSFSGPEEEWEALSGYTSGPTITVSESILLPEDGQYLVEFRASDLAGNGPSSSGPILVRADTTPPSTSNLFVAGASNNSVQLLFSLAEDLSFQAYEIHVSTDDDVTLGDPVWGIQQDPDLGIQSTNQTIVAGLQPGTAYWFRLWAIDEAGNQNAGSNTVHRVTVGTPLAPVLDLRATVTEDGVELTWTPPATDINGDAPVAIERYEVHASDSPWFEPTPDTRIAVTQDPVYLVQLPRTQSLFASYRVISIGSGLGTPLTGMELIPAGSFTMGPDPLDHGSAHDITLTNSFWMDAGEVTNLDYMNALQWALDQGYVTATTSTITAYGEELLDLDDIDCEIQFNEATSTFSLIARTHSTDYGGPGPAYPNGYDPGRHPVKEVSWYGAACYCDWRSEMEGLSPFYQGNWSVDSSHNPYQAEGYRLPTEAEWEYAARYNDGRLYPWGNTAPEGCEIANLNCVGWSKNVGLYPAGDNQLGIKDLIGNILEFTNDWYAEEYQLDQTVNPLGPTGGIRRACRGSDFGDAILIYAQATTRQNYPPEYSASWIGFRTVRTENAVQQAYPGELITVPAGTAMWMWNDGVTLSHDFRLGRTEVTNAEYCAALNWALQQGLLEQVSENTVEAHGQELLDLNGACEIAWVNGQFAVENVLVGDFAGQSAALHPVIDVTWYGAACYSDWLTIMEGLDPYYNGNWDPSDSHNPYDHIGYRLPTEAEWEYAARYNDGRAYPWGDSSPEECQNCNYTNCVGWTSPSGYFIAGSSSLGLQALSGNVWEWVNDHSSPDLPIGHVVDPFGAEEHESNVRRGGSWAEDESHLASQVREGSYSHSSTNTIGFRVLRSAP